MVYTRANTPKKADPLGAVQFYMTFLCIKFPKWTHFSAEDMAVIIILIVQFHLCLSSLNTPSVPDVTVSINGIPKMLGPLIPHKAAWHGQLRPNVLWEVQNEVAQILQRIFTLLIERDQQSSHRLKTSLNWINRKDLRPNQRITDQSLGRALARR